MVRVLLSVCCVIQVLCYLSVLSVGEYSRNWCVISLKHGLQTVRASFGIGTLRRLCVSGGLNYLVHSWLKKRDPDAADRDLRGNAMPWHHRTSRHLS